jgi:hypothetical protein
MAFPTFREWLGGRTPTSSLIDKYNEEKIFASRSTTSSASTGTRGTRMPPEPPTPPSGTRGSRMIPESGSPARSTSTATSRPTTNPSAVGSGTRTNGSRIKTNPRFDTRNVPVNPSRIRVESYTPPPSVGTPPSGGTPPPSPSGSRMTPEQSMKIGRSVAAQSDKGGSRLTQLGKAVGKVVRPVSKFMNSPAAKMASKVVVPYFGAKAAGDLFGAAEPYIDMARYGHKLPYKDGVGGRDNRLNDVLGNIPFNVREAMSPGQTQRDLSALTGGASDKFFKTIMPYRERATAEPAAFKKPDGVGGPKTAGQKPMTPAPDAPSSIPDMGRQGRAQSKALRDPDSYLGSAFDATLRKGISTGRNYLQSQMNKDGLDSDMQSKIMARYNDKIAEDKLLSAKGNEEGLVGAINRNDANRPGATAGRGERTLDAYRQVSPQGKYGKGAKAAEIQRKFVKQ